MSETAPDYRALMSKALLEIKDLKSRLKRHDDERAEPIAIIGMACRFPGGANNPDLYWRLLRDGVDAIVDVPADRWNIDRLHDPERDAPGKMLSRHGGFIDDIDGFDASFFGISPREAEIIDPHQRVLLEVCWEALEYANLVPETLFGANAGVFIGVSGMDQILNKMGESPLTDIGPYHGTGCALAPIAGRVSYSFGFSGPSFVVDTACSSSLLSLHLAAESLRRRECDLALGGGVHLHFHPGISVAFSKAGMLSVDGRCKTFDAAANGYVRGEGCGVVVLKRLSDAKRDGDPILALLRGSAVNQDGASGGLTVPSGPSQEQVIRQALARAGIDASHVDYVEAHGTGTPLGDPIELGALSNVFKQSLLVGSVKTNIGHLEASAGIAGTIKVILALQHQAIPPHLHFFNPNPLVPWQEMAISVPTSLTPWSRPAHGERIAGVSAFGFSGTNVHLLLSEALDSPIPALPAVELTPSPRQACLLALSARSHEVLRSLAKRWSNGPLAALPAAPVAEFADLCATAVACREVFTKRLCVVAQDAGQARAALEEFAKSDIASAAIIGTAEAGPPQVAFLFSGQGSQYLGMGSELYRDEPVFRDAIDECDRLLHPELGLSIASLLYSDIEIDGAKRAAALTATLNTQPALFALEYALARLWQSWGVKPAAVLGHSVGEYVAAHLAGVFSLADGLRLIAARARLMQALPGGGAMAAVFADATQVEAALSECNAAVSIAAYNGPRNTVIAGVSTDIEPLIEHFLAQGIECRRLTVSHAFHSPLMDPMLAAFRVLAEGVKYSSPRMPVISNISGGNAGDDMACADYWVRHVRAPVRFAAGVRELLRQGCLHMIEIGPSETLTAMARQNDQDSSGVFSPSLRKGENQRATMLAALGGYWAHGGSVHWVALGGRIRRNFQLPAYPFAHPATSKPIEVDAARAGLHGVTPLDLALLARRFNSPLLRETLFETVLSTKATPFIDDHRVFGQLVVAGASHLSMVLSAAALIEASEGAVCVLTDVVFPSALIVPEEGERVLQLAIGAPVNLPIEFRLVSISDDEQEPTLHAKGRIAFGGAPVPLPDLAAIRQRCDEELPVADVYSLQRRRHIVVGPSYQWLTALRRGNGETMAHLVMPSELSAVIKRYSLHPGLIDCCFGALVVAMSMDVEESFIPFSLEALHCYRSGGYFAAGQTLIAHAVVRRHDKGRLMGDIHLYSEQGEPVAALIGLEGRAANRHALLAAGSSSTPGASCYRIAWQALPEYAKSAKPQGSANYLVLADARGIGEHLAVSLRNAGGRVTLAMASPDATALQQAPDGRYMMSATSANAFRQLLELCGPVDTVVYLWGLSPLIDEHGLEGLASYQENACAGALHMLQALDRQNAGRHSDPAVQSAMATTRTRFLFVTQGAQAVTPADSVLAPHQGMLWGLGQVAADEHPQWACICLDLDSMASLDRCVADLESSVALDASENRVAWRDGRGYAARLETHRLAMNQVAIRADATYVITGANGALGRQLMLWLVQRGARHLALISRGAPDMALSEMLTARGAQPRFYQADASDRVALGGVLDNIRQKGPRLEGVFHLAGVLDDGVITTQSWERWACVLAPKVSGAWNLHCLTLSDELRFFVAFSSVAALLGAAGQASYAAANAFMDALVKHRRAAGLPGLSVNWGPWGDSGMAAQLNADQRSRIESLGMGGIGTRAALDTLAKLMGGASDGTVAFDPQTAQLAVLAMAWQRYGESRSLPFLDRVQAPQAAGRPMREKLQNAGMQERRSILVDLLVDLVTTALRLPRDEVAPRQRLFDLGVDSLIALELKNRLQSTLGMTLSSTLLFDYPSIEALSSFLMDQLWPAAALRDSTPPPAVVGEHGALEALTEDEAEFLLLARLESLEKSTQ